ncbi:Helo-like-N domain-containing protein [Fusarium keratoplasticum]|uniref:Helo-like-N domain-containing protein n=1 Tax=Fusarium keratoplasticum TaxID=1328300 RepID=A0ACC0QUG3_9HYPO|nr:Helo-like-N domain-containing protein [Fusarium keratoplasticum]KAI8668636.1 Helo-like-N domain-containing protein [Fusarium keratoplasticum]
MDSVTGALAIIDLSIKSAKGIRDFLRNLNDAPQTVAQLAQDVEILSTFLERLSQCPLDISSPKTVASLRSHLDTCANTLSDFDALLKSLHPVSTSRADRLRMRFRAVRKDKDIEKAQDRIRAFGTQINLYLTLLQAEATARTSSINASTAETTESIIQQILAKMGRIQDPLDKKGTENANPTATGELAGNRRQDISGVAEPEAMEACSKLEESVSRLSRLVGNNGSTLDAEDAGQIINDLERLIQSARDKVWKDQSTLSLPQELPSLPNELRMIGGMIYSAPVIAINPNSIKQKRLREEIGIDCGVLTITTNKRKRLVHEKTSEGPLDKEQPHGDVVAGLSFRPTNHALTIHISVTQGQLFDHCVQSIPRISINPIIPRGSPVFDIVRQGRIHEFRVMLAEGKTNYATAWPEICQLLIEAGLDVDAIGCYNHRIERTPLIIAQQLDRNDILRLLLQHGADPLLDANENLSPLVEACAEADASALRFYTHYGAPFLSGAVNEVDEMGRTMLHRVCGSWPRGHCNCDALAALIDAGANIQARVTNNYMALMKGFTCLHTLVYFAWNPSTSDELENLVYLIQRGASVYTVDDNHRSVSMTAYIQNEFECEGEWTPVGGYRGDLWDAALVTCGYNLSEFRRFYPRAPRYDSRYKRSDFEKLWEGIEHLCPYWDDHRWPETGTHGGYSMDADDEGSGLPTGLKFGLKVASLDLSIRLIDEPSAKGAAQYSGSIEGDSKGFSNAFKETGGCKGIAT